ncbi:MAG: lipopolysaccharide heptosyltransferase II [Candidatus Omnitrophica bacterium]|jgi:heptosyltransferase-2/heptosyltransferase-3|nr:lipopolysaccharide heptosyltransferase II [Candidatus Omnitrophota bacterium]
MEKNKRILIFNVNWIGDVLFSTAVLRNIRRNYPGSFIACIIPGRCYPVLKGNPHLDEVIIFDEHDRHKNVFSKFSFVQLLKRKRFDTAILLHGSLTRALICKLADIPEIIGYNTKKRGWLLSKKIPLPAKDALHRIDFYLNIIEKAGLRVEDRYLEFFISEDDEKFTIEFLDKQGIARNETIIGINTGGNWLPKRWPKEYWMKLIQLIQNELGLKVVISGGHQDLTLARKISEQLQDKPLITCGLLNLKQSAALLKRLDLFISGDSGPLHIANTVGTKKIIALFGPTHSSITGPFPAKNVTILQKDVGCKVPCYEVNCEDNRCMKAITPEEVLGQIKMSLNE